MAKKDLSYRIFIIFVYVFLALVALACLYPLYYVVIASISNPEELIKQQGLLLLPIKPFTLQGYKMVFHNKLVLSGYGNTMFILITGVMINMVMTTIGAYVISIRGLMFRKQLTLFIVFTMYFSGGMIPAYLNVRDLGLMNSVWALILPGAIGTGNLIIMRSAFMSIPESLVDAAMIDGAFPLDRIYQNHVATEQSNIGCSCIVLCSLSLEFLVLSINLYPIQQ